MQPSKPNANGETALGSSQALDSSPALSSALRAEIERDLAAAAPAQVGSRRRRFLLSSGAFFLALVCTSLSALRLMPATLLLSGAVISVGIAALFMMLGFPRARLPRAFEKRTILFGTILGSLLLMSLLARNFLGLGEFFAEMRLNCFLHVLVTGGLALALNLALYRRIDPYSPALSGALLGALSALLGVLSVGISCAAVEGWHLVLGHGAAVATLAAVGALLGRKVLAP